MEGTIQNRDKFLNKIAGQLCRPRISAPIQRPQWKHRPRDEIMKNATQDELVEALKKQCNSIHTNFYQTDKQDLASVFNKVVENYGGRSDYYMEGPAFWRMGIKRFIERRMAE